MPIFDVREMWHERGGSIFPRNGLIVREYRRIFRVRTTSPYSGKIEVQQAAGIPRLFTPYVLVASPVGESDLGAVVVKVDPRNDPSSPYEWRVIVDYSSDPQADPIDVGDDPLDKPTVMSWSGENITVNSDVDLENKLYATTAHEPYAGGYPLVKSLPRLRIVRNEPAFNDILANSYRNAVNDDLFFGYPPDAVLCKTFDGITRYSGNQTYWEVTYEFLFKFYLRDETDPGGFFSKWIPTRVLDAGNYVLTNGVQVRALDDRGVPFSAPVRLDGAGARLAVAGTPVYNDFTFYKRKTFGNLNLP